MLTSNSADDSFPSWSPDGTQLLESRTLDGSAAVVAVAVDGSGERVVRQETPGTYSLVPFWGAGGSSILYVAGLLYNDRELYSIRPSGTGLRQLTRNRRTTPTRRSRATAAGSPSTARRSIRPVSTRATST